ncbi:ankyrin repeat domain-containing protein [Actinoplanes couchii]|uniref:Ankyrin n=1 Tax=Actinoplanes couchii TaxID=403638 RepID=A0ABQ3XHN0_9ACTN|nr:ankyrin repeat domain-containing protein [Actinoplanes couchii]MDR6317620.1 hypothetical protein [Actinoplanes couchii]GID58004.1 hypothetical protein Aco03nite_064080 [Actinoplanes couchii]
MSGQDQLALAEWQRIRRYAVPDRMIAECTEARERGDWRAACEAAEVDVLIDDPTPVADELAGFAPDLLRWHLPRALGGYTTLVTSRRYVLVPHDGVIGPDSTVLVVESPRSLIGSQRLTLQAARWGDVPGDDSYQLSKELLLPAYLWDARHAGELRTAVGGTAERLPGFAPDGSPLPDGMLGAGDDAPARAESVRAETTLAARFAAAGFETGKDFGEQLPPYDNGWNIHNVDPLRVAHDARLLADRFGTGEWTLWIDYYWYIHLTVDGGTPRADWHILDRADLTNPVRLLPRLHTDLTRYPVDLDLIRNGRLTAGDLHPLVRAALFPGVPAAPARPVPPATPARVRCHGAWHEIGVQQGRLTLPGHTEAERQRERAMRAFGGAVTGCFAAEQTWSGTAGRLPKKLRAHREDLWQRMLHGGTRVVRELLEAGMDPNLRDSRGRTLVHRLRSYDHQVLLPLLLAAGADVNARDLEDSTPLYLAVVFQAPAELIIALVEAGADPRTPNQDGMSVLDYLDDVLEYRDEVDPEFEPAVAYLRERA